VHAGTIREFLARATDNFLEMGRRLVELVALAEVCRDRDSVTGPRVGPGEAAAAETGAKDAGDVRPFDPRLWLWIGTLCIALACGFWLGYAALARRVREKFGGIKVY